MPIKPIGSPNVRRLVLDPVMTFKEASEFEGEYLTEDIMKKLAQENGAGEWLVDYDCDAYKRNPDGSEAGACGNATRCVAWLLATETGRPHQVIRTVAGDLVSVLLPDGRVIETNRAPLEAGGLTKDDVIGLIYLDQPNHIRVRTNVPLELAVAWENMCPAKVYEDRKSVV